MTNEVKKEKDLAAYWMEFLQKEFLKETDRAAVILTASLFENALTNILKKYFAPISAVEDDLLEGNNPLATFSSQIKLAYRLGIISSKFAQDLNLVRKMRNEFAHNVHGSNLGTGKLKDLLTNLTKSSCIVKGHDEVKSSYPEGSRGEFLMVASIMLFHLNKMVDDPARLIPIKPIPEEWIYSWTYKKPDTTSATPTLLT